MEFRLKKPPGLEVLIKSGIFMVTPSGDTEIFSIRINARVCNRCVDVNANNVAVFLLYPWVFASLEGEVFRDI